MENKKVEQKIEEKRNKKPIARSIQQLLRRDIGYYGGYSGVNKLFFLVCVIDTLRFHLGEDFVIEETNKELERLKKFEEKTNQPTIYSKIKDWENIKKTLDYIRPKLNEIQWAYDDIKDKTFRKTKEETSKKLNYRKLIKKVSPYQPEIYFMFNLLMKISTADQFTIPPHFFKTPEMSKYDKTPFMKEKPKNRETETEIIIEGGGEKNEGSN